MKLMRRFRRWLTRALPLRGELDEWYEAGLIQRTESGYHVTHRKALGHAPLWRGLNLLANVPFRLPLHVYQDTDDNSHRRAVEHPAYKLLRRRPNRGMKAATFKRTMTYHAIWYGNAYAKILRNGRGEPASLVPLDPQSTKPHQEAGRLWYKTGPQQERIISDDVFHLMGLSHDGLEGLPLIQIMADAIGMGLAAREFAAKFFRQGAQATGVLSIEGGDEDRQTQAMKDFAKLVGPDSAHKVVVNTSGGKFFPLTINPEQAQLLGIREFEDTKVIANVLGIPPHLLGDDAKSSYASLEQENASLLSNSYDPILVEWESEVDAKLLNDGEDGYFAEFKREALLRTDTATQYTAFNKGRLGGWLSVNDIRRSLNLPSIGPAGDVYLVPTNMADAETFAAGDEEDDAEDQPARQPRFALNGQEGADDGE